MNIQEQQQQQRFTTTSHLTFGGCRRLPALLSSTIDFSHTAPQPAAGPIHTPEQSCFCVMYTYSWLSFVQQPTRTFPSYFVVGFCVFPYIRIFLFLYQGVGIATSQSENDRTDHAPYIDLIHVLFSIFYGIQAPGYTYCEFSFIYDFNMNSNMNLQKNSKSCLYKTI
jgi:hypothetical protein